MTTEGELVVGVGTATVGAEGVVTCVGTEAVAAGPDGRNKS
jgi:hypothetical protein